MSKNLGFVNSMLSCYSLAYTKGYKLYALQNGKECWASNDLTSSEMYGECGKCTSCKKPIFSQLKCSNGENCGGAWSNDLYLITPVASPTNNTAVPTYEPTNTPTYEPSSIPTSEPSIASVPSSDPSIASVPSNEPSVVYVPTADPSLEPVAISTAIPSVSTKIEETNKPFKAPTVKKPTAKPIKAPVAKKPTAKPVKVPTKKPVKKLRENLE